jgi:hypothetical protein
MPIANLRDLPGGQLQIARTIVDHDEIVPRAVHLGETQHGAFVPHSPRKANKERRFETAELKDGD